MLVAVAAWAVPEMKAREAASVDEADESVLSSSSDRPGALKIVALGDSYMSGEGAGVFYEGTDRWSNACRRAPTAYPVVVARALAADPPPGYDGVHLTFPACSGAVTTNIGDEFRDEDAEPRAQYSGQPLQIEALREHPDADVVILSVGGNDAGFKDVVLTCSGERTACVEKAGPWLSILDPLADEKGAQILYVQDGLRDVMRQIRSVAQNARLYVTTYPNPLSAASCPKIGMDEGETRLIGEIFLPQLNAEIELAAEAEGFDVVPLFRAFAGAGLCAEGPEEHGPAMNGWRFQRIDASLAAPNQLLRGSMHPTVDGHARVAQVLEARLRADLASTEPPPEVPVPPPDVPPSEVPPGLPPLDVPPPEGPWELRDNTCALVAQENENVARPSGPLKVTGAEPGSPVCVAEYAQPFQEDVIGPDGSYSVTTSPVVADLGGRREVIYRRADGAWVWRIEWPDATAPESGLGPFRAWLGPWWWLKLVAAVAALLLVAVAVERLLAFAARRARRRRMRDSPAA